MNFTAQIDILLGILERFQIEIRRENLGGSGGGLCEFRGKQVFFFDLQSDDESTLEKCLEAVAGLPDLDTVFLPPEIRDKLEKMGNTGR